MGMFDWVNSELSGYEFQNWQTKGLPPCSMNYYLIGADGMFYRSETVNEVDLSHYPEGTYEAHYRRWIKDLRESEFKVYTIEHINGIRYEKAYNAHVKNGRVMHLLAYQDREI